MLDGALAIAGAFFLLIGGFIYAAIQMIKYEKKWEDDDEG